jgi:hypothetical protein
MLRGEALIADGVQVLTAGICVAAIWRAKTLVVEHDGHNIVFGMKLIAPSGGQLAGGL